MLRDVVLARLCGQWLRVITLAGLMAFAACGSDSADEAGPTAQAPTSTAVPVTTVTTAPVTTKAPGLSECTDPARDAGAQPGSDITKVTLRSDGSTLTVTYDLSGMPSAPA